MAGRLLGNASVRRCKLPAEHAVWLVIELALLRHRPLWQVVQEMALTLDGKELPVPSTSVPACQRLETEPMEHLCAVLTQACGRSPVVRAEDLRVLAVAMVWSGRPRTVAATARRNTAPSPGPGRAPCACRIPTAMNCSMSGSGSMAVAS